MRPVSCCLLLLLAVATFMAPAQEMPPRGVGVGKIVHWVTDQTGTLSADEIRSLEARLKAIEAANSNQIVVVIIPTIGMESLEETALLIAEQSGVGKKEKNNGILLLIAKNDRKMRIEVGYGLEGALPDVLAGTIIRNEISPSFRSGDYYGGILAGVEAIDRSTRNEYTADPEGGKHGGGILPLLLLLAVLFVLFNGMRRRRYGLLPMGIPGPFGGGRGRMGGFGGGTFGGGGGFMGGGGSFGGGGASGGW